MPTPIIKLKRGNNQIPSTLFIAELGVDLGTNRLYVGNIEGVPIPIGAEVSGVTFLGPSNNKIPTQNAVKKYVDAKLGSLAATEKPYLQVRLNDNTLTTLGYNTGNIVQAIDTANFITESFFGTSGLQWTNTPNGFDNGFFQTSKDKMVFAVNYNVNISPPNNGTPVNTEFGTPGVFRGFGIRVVDENGGFVGQNPIVAKYYGTKVQVPILTTISTYGRPTRQSANCIVELPKYTDTNQWKLQLFTWVRSADTDGLLEIGAPESPEPSVNDPALQPGYALRIEFIKLSETVN